MKDKKNRSKKEQKERKHKRWVIMVTVGSFFSTMLISYISDLLLSSTGLIVSFVILLIIIALGVVADTVGIAVTAVTLEPFNAMAAKKIKGAKTSVFLVKNASQVSNLCNDVIGDICGIVSGATAVSIVLQLVGHYPILSTSVMSLVLSASVACLTIGGKALGKDVAMKNGTAIIHGIAIPMASVKILFNGQE